MPCVCFAAHDAGVFDAEISPIEVKAGRKTVTLAADEYPRPETTMETLGKLPTVFKKDGVVTAGLDSPRVLCLCARVAFLLDFLHHLSYYSPVPCTCLVCVCVSCVCVCVCVCVCASPLSLFLSVRLCACCAASASGICDGAASLLVADAETVKQHNLKPLARVVGWSVAGVEPTV